MKTIQRHKTISLLLILIITLLGQTLLAASSSAQTQTPPIPLGIPSALQPWQEWVRYQQEFRHCPIISNTNGTHDTDFLCAWPGRLTLIVDKAGVNLSQHWQVEAESWIPLAGDEKYWPQHVSVNGTKHPVLQRNNRPAIYLTAGQYTITARIPWMERPQTLTLPEENALITLIIDEKEIIPLQREGEQLTLGRSTTPILEEEDNLSFKIYRKLTDTIPSQLTSHIQLQVSGSPREIDIMPVLPEHFIPISIESSWPARFDGEGRLLVQVQPGAKTLVVVARAVTPLSQIQARLPTSLTQEIWSYEAIPQLRVTAITHGATAPAIAVDPHQSGVPTAWQHLPAFAMHDTAILKIEERSRGHNADEANRLQLNRELWLDFSGKNYFARDTISGKMQKDWRFDVATPYTLERANMGNEAMLITQGDSKTLSGIEWHRSQVDFNASLRITADSISRLPVIGWQQTFDQVSTTLHLPYGYKLFAARGVDRADDSWVGHWTILDLFFVSFTALLAWRLWGLGGGLITASYLLLALPEPQAPLWTLAMVLALALAKRALPNGRLGWTLRMMQGVALLSLIVVALSFAPYEIRAALYPQLEKADNHLYRPSAPTYAENLTTNAPTSHESELNNAENVQWGSASSLQSIEKVSKINRTDVYSPVVDHVSKMRQRYNQSTVLQTGAGEPNWTLGQQYQLHWSGPVLSQQQVQLIISPPWLTRLLRAVLVALLGVLLWRLSRLTLASKVQAPAAKTAASSAVLSIMGGVVPLLLLGAYLLGGSPVLAQEGAPTFPSASLLEQLNQRINQPPRCAPTCANIAHAKMDMKENSARILLEVHAQTDVAIPLPSAREGMTLTQLRLNGEVTDRLLSYSKINYLSVTRGIQYIELDYTLSASSASLYYELRPMNVTFSSQDWRVEGIDAERLIIPSLHFSRIENSATDHTKSSAIGDNNDRTQQQFPPYVLVTRKISFDLDWTTQTTVTRIAPREGGLTVAVPLLSGEHVVDSDKAVRETRVLAALDHRQAQTSWQARLDQTNTLQLVAPLLSERAEVWRISVNPSWHLSWEGVPVTLPASDEEQDFEFHPLPGEVLTLTLKQPAVASGVTRAIDQVQIKGDIGARASQYDLSFTLRASQGGEHLITLPSTDTEVLSVMRDNTALNLRPLKGQLTLPVLSGQQTFNISLRHHQTVGWLTTSPLFDLGLPAANIEINMSLPQQRWLLATVGPTVGPAVLYWGELVIALVIAFFLAKTRRTSLRFHHWVLLVIGFSTFSWIALALIILWLFIIDWRQRTSSLLDWSRIAFNSMQIGVALLSLIALICLMTVIPRGLLGTPDMGVVGYGSYGNQLSWFADQSTNTLPTTALISLPLWVYRTVMLLWALWLAQIVISWLRQGLSAWLQGGYWRAKPPKSPKKPAS